MSQTALAWPRGLLTLSGWEALDAGEGHHVECNEGVLVVTPKPPAPHRRLSMRLGSALDKVLGPALIVVPDVEVLLDEDPLTVRASDLVVAASDYQSSRIRFTGAQIRLPIEVISPGSRRTDQVTEPSEYADAGIPEYWVIDPATTAVAVYDLAGRTYTHRQTATGRTSVQGCGFDIDLDLATLN